MTTCAKCGAEITDDPHAHRDHRPTVVRITPAGQVLDTTYTLAPGAAATGVIETTYTLAPSATATSVIETRCNCGGYLFHHDGCRGVAEQRQIDAEREHFASKGPSAMTETIAPVTVLGIECPHLTMPDEFDVPDEGDEAPLAADSYPREPGE